MHKFTVLTWVWQWLSNSLPSTHLVLSRPCYVASFKINPLRNTRIAATGHDPTAFHINAHCRRIKSKRSLYSLIKQTYFFLGQKHFSSRFSTLYTLVISSHLTSCGARICKPYILFNLYVTCSLLLAFTNVMHGYSLTIPLKWDPCFHYAYMTRVRRGEEIGFRRLLLSFTATGLIKVTGWIYTTFGIQIGGGNNNDQKGIFHCVLCDFANIRYRSVMAKLITRYTSSLFTKPQAISLTLLFPEAYSGVWTPC